MKGYEELLSRVGRLPGLGGAMLLGALASAHVRAESMAGFGVLRLLSGRGINHSTIEDDEEVVVAEARDELLLVAGVALVVAKRLQVVAQRGLAHTRGAIRMLDLFYRKYHGHGRIVIAELHDQRAMLMGLVGVLLDTHSVGAGLNMLEIEERRAGRVRVRAGVMRMGTRERGMVGAQEKAMRVGARSVFLEFTLDFVHTALDA